MQTRHYWYADRLGYAHCPECVGKHPCTPEERDLDRFTVEIGHDCEDCGRYFGSHWGTFKGREMAEHVAEIATRELRERESIVGASACIYFPRAVAVANHPGTFAVFVPTVPPFVFPASEEFAA